MKILYIVFFILFANIVFSQEEILSESYQDSLGFPAVKENFFERKVFKKINENKYLLEVYSNSNIIKSISTYSDDKGVHLNGDSTMFYPDGIKQNIIPYSNNKPLGKSTTWYENGKLQELGEYLDEPWSNARYYKVMSFWDINGNQKVTDGNGNYNIENDEFSCSGEYKNGFKNGIWIGVNHKNNFSYIEVYEEGNLISGESKERNGNINKYSSLEVRPEPPNGMRHFYDYIAKNFIIPKNAIKNNINGKLLLGFVVDKDGKITNPKVLNSLGYGIDEEGIRVLLAYGNWIPALQKGRRVNCHFTIPIVISN